MDFSFNESQKDVQKLANKILTEQSNVDRLKKIDKQIQRFDKELWNKLGQLGLLGTAFDIKHGGIGLGFIELCLFIEEVGRSVAAVPVIPVLVSSGLSIQKFGNNNQKILLKDS